MQKLYSVLHYSNSFPERIRMLISLQIGSFICMRIYFRMWESFNILCRSNFNITGLIRILVLAFSQNYWADALGAADQVIIYLKQVILVLDYAQISTIIGHFSTTKQADQLPKQNASGLCNYFYLDKNCKSMDEEILGHSHLGGWPLTLSVILSKI